MWKLDRFVYDHFGKDITDLIMMYIRPGPREQLIQNILYQECLIQLCLYSKAQVNYFTCEFISEIETEGKRPTNTECERYRYKLNKLVADDIGKLRGTKVLLLTEDRRSKLNYLDEETLFAIQDGQYNSWLFTEEFRNVNEYYYDRETNMGSMLHDVNDLLARDSYYFAYGTELPDDKYSKIIREQEARHMKSTKYGYLSSLDPEVLYERILKLNYNYELTKVLLKHSKHECEEKDKRIRELERIMANK